MRLTETSLDDRSPLAGQGTLDQVRRDLDDLADLGATHVLLDTYPGLPSEFRPPAVDQRMLDALADHISTITAE